MAAIEFPPHLKQLLEAEHSPLCAPIRALADQVGLILADNKLPFFPDYTDHGTDHINAVLKSEVELVPKLVWDQSHPQSDPRLLSPTDAVVIIGATLLHDIAMHLQPTGFLELIGKDSRFKPLPWFKENHEDHSADRPWSDLWEDYAREARRFSDRALGSIIGLESSRQWKFESLPTNTGHWQRNHCLIIGEFIRRHHARLAHEIAIYGFPGLPVGSGTDQFPAMGTEAGHLLKSLADLIGLTARSHGTSLRVCQAYLRESPSYGKTPRPIGTAVLYSMALLRVADYFQIDRQRAPGVLLQLRNPQSPISVQAWQKHQAVISIDPAEDPRAKMVNVSESLNIELYLQLRDLLAGLQSEMDHSSAVLDEAYGNHERLGLHHLGLTTRRVYSNLNTPAFRDRLPFVPERTGFSADPNILTLLVEPLYGGKPGVGVRELMQNAVDAVRELHAWCNTHGKSTDDLDILKQEADVLIDFVKRDDNTWYLRVQDKGIGMSSETLQHYFLRAGASFRQSPEWAKEFLDKTGKATVLRAGRFGVGAFAIFLLGPSFRLWTRHVMADKSEGWAFSASRESQFVEICRELHLHIGTKIEVELDAKSIAHFGLENEKYDKDSGLNLRTDWFCWDWPKVMRRVIRGASTENLQSRFSARFHNGEQGPEWSHVNSAGFDAVYWTFAPAPRIVCNGIEIHDLGYIVVSSGIGWSNKAQLECPNVAVFDSAANLPLTAQRFQLSQHRVSFENDVERDVTLSFIAHALLCGPESRQSSLTSSARHPLSLSQVSSYDDLKNPALGGRLRWVMTPSAVVPADPWLYSLLQADSYFVWGVLGPDSSPDELPKFPTAALKQLELLPFGMLHWHWKLSIYESEKQAMPSKILTELALKGIASLGGDLEASQVLISSRSKYQFEGDAESGAPVWQRMHDAYARRLRFEANSGVFLPSTPLKPLLVALEDNLRSGKVRRSHYRDKDLPDVIFVAEIKTKLVSRTPESLIAKIWNECLGPQPIPFAPEARKSLIEHGRKHPELKRHIEAWEEMKRTGSEWTMPKI